MIVQCENCSTKFNLPDDRIPKGGAKVKCSKCGNIFKVSPPAPPPPPPPEEEEDFGLDEEFGGDQAEAEEDEDLFGDGFDDEPSASAADEEDEEEEEGFGDFPDDEDDLADDEEEEEDEEYEDEDFEDGGDLSLDSKPKKGGSKKSLIVLLVLVIILGILGAAGWYFKDALFGAVGLSDAANRTEAAQPAQEGQAQPPVSPGDQVKGIGLKNVRQYYLDNEKAGQLFVVEGKAVNNFDAPKEMITVQADLYDGKGAVLASKSVKCGNTLSMYQLQVETPEAIDAALSADVGILANNTYLKKGMDTPFMAVFFNPSPLVREFQVKVVSAQDAKE
ncbi:MAG: hypothetical protein PWQ57_682 [Desulfovibrionales bacterium]|nr:hypothetical protein [Desulfovibrionales bacterium]